jgi:hypothetical protein
VSTGQLWNGSPSPPPERALELAFLPLHKRAFGLAAGVALGLAVCGATIIQLLRVGNGLPLELLEQYYYGYRVSWGGALIGLAWGFLSGFVMGWFFAFCRNLAVAAAVFAARTRAELAQLRDFLDHI